MDGSCEYIEKEAAHKKKNGIVRSRTQTMEFVWSLAAHKREGVVCSACGLGVRLTTLHRKK
jgi:hypothetical protein